MNKLFYKLFGPDYCEYEYTKSKHCVLVPGQFPVFSYDHVQWESAYVNNAQDNHCDGTNGGSVAVLPEIAADKESSKERESVDSVQVIFF